MGDSVLRKYSYSSSHESRSSSVSHTRPPANVLIDGYKTLLDGVKEASSYRDSLKPRPGQWNVDDPISMHLLMETAMGDSQHYQVLSPEDIDLVKKELSDITRRIHAAKRKLALETKLRDAAQSINKLNSSKSRVIGIGGSSSAPQGHRRLGSKGDGSGILERTEDELQENTRKFEELAMEIWELEQQEQDLNRRLLEHTAGVLQMTHKGYLKKEIMDLPQQNGHSTSTSVHTDLENAEFGDQSYYRPYSQVGMDTGDSNGQLNITTSTEFAQHNLMIIEIETRVEDLNARLRDMILELKPRKEDLPQPPRDLADDPANPTDILWEQIEFLDQCLDAMHELQGQEQRANPTTVFQMSDLAVEEKLETLNSQLYDIMNQNNQDENKNYFPPPEASGEGLQDQIDYLQGGLRAVGRRIRFLVEEVNASSLKLSNYQERAEQYVSVIGSLWDTLTASDSPLHQQDLGHEGFDDLSSDDFSLQAFSAKVQELHARSIELSDHKAVLTRQVQQQRELNDTADTAKDTRMNAMRKEIEDANQQLERKIAEAKIHRDELAALKLELESAKQAVILQDQRRSLEASEALKAEKEARIQAENATEQKMQRLIAQLDESKETTAAIELNALTLRSDFEEKSRAATNWETSTKALEGEIVRLQTELTFAKAELDGAYGTRAQRAAEVAADPAIHRELEALKSQNSSLSAEMGLLKASNASHEYQNAELQSRINALQDELSDTIGDYEAMTKASIDHERERERLEAVVDTLRDRVEALDTQLSEEKVQMLGIRNPGGSKEGGTVANTSTMVLKNEFKKMIRETRAEHAKALRAEQDERRRLEIQLRALKKEPVPSRLPSTRS
ncbi:hypothetical protein MMC26_000166 [Xylographa opegraphella]|nr:hypothetical protein [Xylographa opegraphella]